VNPPRAVYLDFPLGHTAGKQDDKALQRKIMIDTLSALDSIQVPGTIRELPYRWASDDAWKDRVMRPDPASSGKQTDERVARVETPQYQSEDDRVAALATLADGGCKTCVFLEDRKP
jgi:hypothetical protein